MKILKYLIFLSILCVIFSVIYRQSDKKGFRRWRTSFKTAIIFSAIAAGLIPVNPEAIEPPGNNNQVYQERLLSDQEFNSFEDNYQKVILVKTGDSSPSVPTSPGRGQPNPFPTPPSGGRPTRPSTGVNPYGIYRPTPKVVDQGLGAGANPAGAGGGGGAAEFDDQCPAPKKQQQSQKSDRNEFQSTISNSKKKKKKKQEADQCELNENITHKINEKFESNAVKKLVKTALDNQRVKQEYEVIKKRLKEGVNPIDIGKKSTRISSNKVLIKGAHGRYVVEISGNQVNVLGIGARGNAKNMNNFRDLMNEKYGLNLQY